MSERYLHIFFQGPNDYNNIQNSEFIRCCSLDPKKNLGKLAYFIYDHHTHGRFKKILPFKNFWERYLLDKECRRMIKKTGKACFHFFGIQYILYIETGYIDRLKKLYPKAKFVFSFTDKVARHYKKYEGFDIEKLKKEVDLVLTYNSFDAQNYGITKIPIVLKNYDNVLPDEGTEESDVFYVGREKGRLDKILSVAKRCRNCGLKISFNLVDVPPEKQAESEGVHYVQYIPYTKMLSMEKRAKAILNIYQDGTDGFTLRDKEAVGMNKVLITDSTEMTEYEIYTESKVVPVDKIEEQIDKIKGSDDKVKWNNVEKFSLDNYYTWLDNELDKISR